MTAWSGDSARAAWNAADTLTDSSQRRRLHSPSLCRLDNRPIPANTRAWVYFISLPEITNSGPASSPPRPAPSLVTQGH